MAAPLHTLLGRFKKILSRGTAQKEHLIESIKDKTGVEIHTNDISIQNGIAHISCDPTLKSEIFLHKKEILTSLNSNSGRVIDIR